MVGGLDVSHVTMIAEVQQAINILQFNNNNTITNIVSIDLHGKDRGFGNDLFNIVRSYDVHTADVSGSLH